ncbi:MAG: hypothetical protein COB36_13800 [Alphaproteobacteria bacterium]|nr:MAG: hypothetical protein COB36_13800 [Alphaproteobacteria bacterium]
MTEESYLLDKKEKSWLSRLLKVIFVLCAFILIGMTVLSNMGGSNDDLKNSVERFVGDLFGGKKVVVGNLVYMSFFPRLGFDAESVNVLSRREDGHVIAHIGKVQAFMTFWNVVTQMPKITNFYIEDLTIIKGVMGAKELYIEKIFIDHDVETETAKIRGNGTIGVHPWSFVADIDIFGKKGSFNYMFQRSVPVVFDIANIHFEGVLLKHEDNYYKLENFKLSSGDKMLQGNIILSALGKKLLKLKGNIEISGGHSRISPDVIFDYAQSPVKISGKILSDNFVYSDVVGTDAGLSILTRLRDIVGYGAMLGTKASFIGQYNLDVNFDLKNVKIADTLINNLKFPVIQNNIGIKLGPINSDLDVMPSLMFVVQKDTGNIHAILQDGALDTVFLKEWLKNIPAKLGDRVETECGFATFVHDGGDLAIQGFAINMAQGSIRVRNSKLSSDQNINDLDFYVASKKAEFEVIELDKDAYDFVQSSLQSAAKASPCSSYISQIPEKDEVNVEVNVEVSGEAQE